ncbi:FHA domain-containing protein [Massilia sp. YIM B02443]|uniref:FHA domain-containing protein n=1 Tax=Massilia sp. YIM B02443 TaxID=3050127 RepID=UPI0025B635F4|nr:FHA domain-containing protein [Massilia sp. YIM B02443]MDN4040036.1 FHA domain-containing protein [Massilia sp. YIM B02443]
MNRCRNPEHPHCTVWVMPGDAVCEHGHAQPEAVSAEGERVPAAAGAPLPTSYEAVKAVRTRRDTVIGPLAATLQPGLQRPQLHISGFDPRAAGGRQAIRLELRGMPMDCASEVRMLVRSSLKLSGGASYVFQRTTRGEWRPLFLEFSSRGVEHGQHRIEIELHSRHPAAGSNARTWICSPVILVPRHDAGLAEIHQTFLATHKNVRVTADDAGIARVHAPGGGRIDIDVSARNGSIAHLNLDHDSGGSGKIDLGMSTIAWDEDLIEIDLPHAAGEHPCPASSACLVHAEADSATQRHVRLFALDECVLGRFEAIEPDADLLLAHHGEAGEERGGLTRRLSGRHAVIRRGRAGFEIEDVSRYGLLLDGVWPGKHLPVPLRAGMRIEFTASIKGIVTLEVTALLPHAVVLHRLDAGARAECFYLMAPDCAPNGRDVARANIMPRAAALPVLFHRDGGFWQLDRASGQEQPLTSGAGPARMALPGLGASVRFTPDAYPETRVSRRRPGERRSHLPAALLDA